MSTVCQQKPEEQQQIVPPTTKGLYLSRWASIGLVAGHVMTVCLLIASLIIAMKMSHELGVDSNDVLVHKKDNLPLRVQEHLFFLKLSELEKLPLISFQKPTSLIIKINALGSDIYRLYSIKAIEFESGNGKNSSLTLFLSMGHRLALHHEKVVLYNADDLAIQAYDLHLMKKIEADVQTIEASGTNETSTTRGHTVQTRQLLKKPTYNLPFGYAYPAAMFAPVVYPVMYPMACPNCGLYYSGLPATPRLY